MDDPSSQIVNDAQMDYVKNWINTSNGPELKGLPVFLLLLHLKADVAV